MTPKMPGAGRIPGDVFVAFVAGVIATAAAVVGMAWSYARAVQASNEYPHGWRLNWRERRRLARRQRERRRAT